MSFAFEFLSSQQDALKKKSEFIVSIEEKVSKLAAEKLVIDELASSGP